MAAERRVIKTVLSKEQSEGVGARVRRSIGRPELKNLDPFLLLDEFKGGKPAGFPDHPHRGFETVTYLLEGGSMAHEDFCGHTGRLNPGDLQWMTAGRGILHAEMPCSEEPAHGLQLWVNLRSSEKMVEPQYQELKNEDIPKPSQNGVTVAVISGEALGIQSKVYTRTPTLYLDFKLDKGVKHTQAVPKGWTAFIYTLSGDVYIGPSNVQEKIEAHHTAVLDDGDCVQVENKRASLSALEWSEQQLRKAASLEELLRITHSEDWKLWKCRLKLKSVATMDSRSASHRSTRFAAAFYDIEILKVIDEEWQRTQCMPRETCIEVAKELGTTTNKFFKPPCVNVYRCGGCCNEESLSCMNTSTSYVSKMLFEISVPLTNVPDPIQVKIANHTGCKCLSNVQHQPQPIIRRSVQNPQEDECSHRKKLCHNGWIWDFNKCECIEDEDHPGRGEGLPPLSELAMCAPNMDFDEENCECICKWKCPGNLFQNKENCSCYLCTENQDSCFQKHKTFNSETCSCEDKCPFQMRMCPTSRPLCSRHCRCLRGGRGHQGSQSKENP